MEEVRSRGAPVSVMESPRMVSSLRVASEVPEWAQDWDGGTRGLLIDRGEWVWAEKLDNSAWISEVPGSA